MKKNQEIQRKAGLRRKAEKILDVSRYLKENQLDEGEMINLIHELEVYRIELELQNEELIQARTAEAAITERYTEFYDFAPVGYAALSDDGIILNINFQGAKLLGKNRSDLINSNIYQFVAVDYRSAFSGFLNGIFIDSKPHSDEIDMVITSKNVLNVRLTGIQAANQKECLLTLVDITEANLQLKALKDSERRMCLAVANSPIPIMIHDEEGMVMKLSVGWTNFSGYTIDDIPTYFRWSELALNGKGSLDKRWIEQLFYINQTEDCGEYTIHAKDGSERIWALQITPLGHLMNGKGVIHRMAVDITEQKRAEENNIKARENAETSSKLISSFLANMSHEIRTPMNGILGFTELLKDHQLTGKERDKYIEIIDKSGERMLHVINDIIDISKIDSGQFKMAIAPVNLNQCMQSLFEFFSYETKAKGIDFAFDRKLKIDSEMVETDLDKINSIVTNLIKNAIKFTNSGSIMLRLKKKKKMVEIAVSDTGIGIGEDDVNVVFDRFRQAENQKKVISHGSGLGLAISKAYAEALGGTLKVSSQLNVGSTFVLTIPA